VWDALTSEEAVHALTVTLIVAFCAVIGNTVFGLVASFLLVRTSSAARRSLTS
jgi:ABC-type sulfate transport system permease component